MSSSSQQKEISLPAGVLKKLTEIEVAIVTLKQRRQDILFTVSQTLGGAPENASLELDLKSGVLKQNVQT